MTPIETEVFESSDALALGMASQFVQIVGDAVERTGRCSIALAGGSTPKHLYQRLSSDTFRPDVPWQRVDVFLSDERYVPIDHADSNYRMAREALLDHVPVDPERVHPVQTHLPAAEAALAYEERIRHVLESSEPSVPSFDLILLGIGSDAHTASLFPHTGALQVSDRLVVDNWVPQQDAVRITFTVPLLQEATRVIMLATGDDKADAIWQLIEGPEDPSASPCQHLRAARGIVTIALDPAAAGRLRASA